MSTRLAAMAAILLIPAFGYAAKPTATKPPSREEIAATVAHLQELAQSSEAKVDILAKENESMAAENEKLKGFLNESTKENAASNVATAAAQQRGDALRAWGIGEQARADEQFARAEKEKAEKIKETARADKAEHGFNLLAFAVAALAGFLVFGLCANISMKFGIIAGVIATPAVFAAVRFILPNFL